MYSRVQRMSPILALIIAAQIVTLNCGKKYPVGPEGQPTGTVGKLAIEARAIIAAADAAVTKFDEGMTAGTIPKDVGLKAVAALREVGVKTRDELVPALRVMDAATGSVEEERTNAERTIAAIQALLVSAVSPLDEATKAQVGQLFAEVNSAIEKVKALLSAFQPSARLEVQYV